MYVICSNMGYIQLFDAMFPFCFLSYFYIIQGPSFVPVAVFSEPNSGLLYSEVNLIPLRSVELLWISSVREQNLTFPSILFV